MELDQKIQTYINNVTTPELSKKQLTELTQLIDLTSLNTHDEEKNIITLCEKAITPLGNAAAICVYPKFIPTVVKAVKNTPIKIATVANFPTGQVPLTETLSLVQSAIRDGANEIDLVFPYLSYQNGNKQAALDYISTCHTLCTTITLKVILEVSAFKTLKEIYLLSTELIELGVHFIKTSTGKTAHGATLESACAMLLAINDSQRPVGFKAAGGIRTFTQAATYLNLAKHILGEDWPTPAHFRIGTSGLIGN